MIKLIHVGVLPLSFAMARVANIQEAIDRAVTWREDNTKVSPGFLIETLTAAIMATHGHMPLSHMEEYWRDQDLGATISQHKYHTRTSSMTMPIPITSLTFLQ